MKNEDTKSHLTTPIKSKDYMVTATVGKISRRMVWHDHEPLKLDHPKGWVLSKAEDELCIFDSSNPDQEQRIQDAVLIASIGINKRVHVQLPPAHNGRLRTLDITITPLVPLQPPYMQVSPEAYPKNGGPRQLMMYHGIRYFLLKYRPVGPKFTSHNANGPIFTYERNPSGYSVRALVSGFIIKSRGKKRNLPMGATCIMDESEFFSAAFVHRIYWWRFRSVLSPDALPPLESDENEENAREAQRFLITSQLVVASLFLLLIASTAYNHFFPQKPAPIVTKIELKAPKVIPHTEIAEVKPTPAPTPEPEPPKEVVKEKEKPKPVAKKEKPKEKPKKIAKKQPVPKPIVKKEAPPKHVAKKEPTPKKSVEPPPRKVAKKEPVVAPAPPVKKVKDTPPSPGVVAKKVEAPPPPDESVQLAKSLSFLSSGAKSPKKGGAKYDKSAKKDFMNAPTLAAGSKDTDALDKLATNSGDSNIKTRSSRNIASDAGFDAPAGKGLNEVQGKVSLTQLYSAGGASSEGFEDGAGISLSGPGELSEAEIEKALAKYLSRFQFCYEKALLSDSTLAGNIRLQWEISTSGHVSSAKVLNSQMKNKGLHSCITGVLKEIPFPKPKGGSVIAKKTFSFKSSAL